MTRKYAISDIFIFDSTTINDKNGEAIRIRCDCTVDVELTHDGKRGCVNPESVEIHELTDMDGGLDMTYMKESPAILKDVYAMINKREGYLIDKAGD